ncbi:MAG: hypothetical protein RIC55_18460 [Pirellulaceae bacterium]
MSPITLTRTLVLLAITLTTFGAVHAEGTQADFDAYNTAVDVYNARVARYEHAAAAFNDERNSYHHAVNYYNSLSEDQRTQFQYDRLERWYATLERRLGELNAEWDYLQRRGAELDAWYARLQG